MSAFWDKLKRLLPAIELAGNVALLATPLAGVEPLVAQLENATQAAVQSIGTPQSVSNEEALIYSAIIGVLVTLEKLPNLPAATLTQIQGFITAAQAGIAGYYQGLSGFIPQNYQPVTPIP